MAEYGLKDQYEDERLYGNPEDFGRFSQYNIPANAVCLFKSPESMVKPNSQIQHLAPLRFEDIDKRTDTYEKTSICDGGSPRSHSRCKESFDMKLDKKNIISLSEENIFWIFLFVIFVFIIIHFESSLNEIKQLLGSSKKGLSLL